MTNLDLYKTFKKKLDAEEVMQASMERILDSQKEVVEQLDYETSELYSKLTDEEKKSLEVF